MKEETNNYKQYILKNVAFGVKILRYLAFLVIIIATTKIAFRYFSPFIFALLISFFIKPLVKILHSFKIKKGFSVALSILIVYGGLIYFFILITTRGLAELIEFGNLLPLYTNNAYDYFYDVFSKAEALYIQLPPEVLTILTDVAKGIFDKLSTLLTATTKTIINTMTLLPKFGISVLISTVTTFFILKDEEKIFSFFIRQFSQPIQQKFIMLKHNLLKALVGFLKAQLIILTITFFESLIGLSIIRVKYAFIISLLIAIIDILPVLGTGSVYVPWAIISILNGKLRLGISLFIIYGVIVVVRYLVEPKIVGHHLGVHPLITLISMFVGAKVFGVGGIILGPVIVMILIASQRSGILPDFK
ncbi:MAG: sporulation integral membrane protein YtvI [Clostridiales bacterium]|nr:sporulation integral membrane protein YtvI [Clostridiales bacterium]